MERDVVFCVAPKVHRRELQYALRSLDMVPHGRVFMVGDRPSWVVNVEYVPMRHVEKWTDLTRVWQVFPKIDGLTSEFYYTEDDYFITAPVDEIPNYYHRSTLAARLKKDASGKGGWGKSMQNTYRLLVANGYPDPRSFDVHIPMVVEKDRIPYWDLKEPWLRYRSLVGNTSTRPAVEIVRDVKCQTAGDVADVQGKGIGFLSSSDHTFKQGVEPVLRRLFPDPCRYEKEHYMSSFEPESAYDQPHSGRADKLARRKARIVERRIPRNGPPLVKYETGEWVPESEVEVHVASELAGDLEEE